VTDKLRSYGVAHRELMPDVFHDTSRYANNRAEQSHEPTRKPRFDEAFCVSGYVREKGNLLRDAQHAIVIP
jgi:hypothetical protein